MAQPVLIVLTVEGVTDTRFLGALLESVFQEMALRHVDDDVDCTVYVQGNYDKTEGFTNGIIKASKMAMSDFGASTLAVHSDSDRMTYDNRRSTNFDDVFEAMEHLDKNEYCTVVTPVIPVRMLESWMLADRDMLRMELGTTMTNAQLGIDGNPEEFADPKAKIEEAINKSKSNATHKRPANSVRIADLYQIIGKTISIGKLEQLDSFRRFEEEILVTFRKIGLRVR